MGKPIFQIAEREGLWTYDEHGELVQVEDNAEVTDGPEGLEVSHAKLVASYTIAVEDTIADLVASVCDLVVEGWVPIGSPFFVNRTFDGAGWHQALFKGERYGD